MGLQPTLCTKRLILRPFELSDAKTVQELAGDWAIADTTLSIPYPYEDGAAEQWISTHKGKFEAREFVNFAVILRRKGQLVGAIGLALAPHFDRAELGYWTGKPFWDKGYCTEASEAVLEYGFLQLGLNRIYAQHLKRNPASGRVMQKLGMRREGTVRQHVKKWSNYEDLVIYGLLRTEWERRRRRTGRVV